MRTIILKPTKVVDVTHFTGLSCFLMKKKYFIYQVTTSEASEEKMNAKDI